MTRIYSARQEETGGLGHVLVLTPASKGESSWRQKAGAIKSTELLAELDPVVDFRLTKIKHTEYCDPLSGTHTNEMFNIH